MTVKEFFKLSHEDLGAKSSLMLGMGVGVVIGSTLVIDDDKKLVYIFSSALLFIGYKIGINHYNRKVKRKK